MVEKFPKLIKALILRFKDPVISINPVFIMINNMMNHCEFKKSEKEKNFKVIKVKKANNLKKKKKPQ